MMDYAQAESLIHQFAALGGQQLTLTGGEPLEYPRCNDAIRLGKNLGMRVTLFSMGVLNGMELGLGNLSEMPNEWFFSLHGASPRRHEELTQVRGSFDSTVAAARRIVAAGVRTNVSFVATDSNLPDLVDLAQLCAEIGVQEIRVLTVVPQGRGERMRGTPEKVALFAGIKRAREASGIPVRLGEATKAGLGLRNTCKAVHEELIVNWNGWISPCHTVEPRRSDHFEDNAFKVPLTTLLCEAPTLRECRSFAIQIGSIGCSQGCLAQRALLRPSLRDSVPS